MSQTEPHNEARPVAGGAAGSRAVTDRMAPATTRVPVQTATALARRTTTARTRSRSSRASRRSASVPRCTSARPALPGLHHLVYEIVDNSIDEALAGHCDQVNVTLHIDHSVTVVDNGRGIPIDQHAERPLGRRSRADRAPRRRQVRQRQLQGVGRSARRRRVGRERAVGDSSISRSGATARSTTRGISAARRTAISRSPGRPRSAAPRSRSSRTTQIFETTEFSFDTLAQRLRELAFLNGGVTITLDDERDGKSAQVPVRRRHHLVRRVPEPEQDDRQRQADPHARREGRHRRRDRAAVERRLRRDGVFVREQHQHARRRHAPVGFPLGADADDQLLRRQEQPGRRI